MSKSITTVSVDTELKDECKRRGVNISKCLEESLRDKLKDTSYLSPTEKKQLNELKEERKMMLKKEENRIKDLDNLIKIDKEIDAIEFHKKKDFLKSKIPNLIDKDNETTKLWYKVLDILREGGLRIGFRHLEHYHKNKGVKQKALNSSLT